MGLGGLVVLVRLVGLGEFGRKIFPKRAENIPPLRFCGIFYSFILQYAYIPVRHE